MRDAVRSPNPLVGAMELIWSFGPKLDEGSEITRQEEGRGWKIMYPEVAMQVEQAFSSCNTRLYCQVGDYLYDFRSMQQTNLKFGTKRPIKRQIVCHWEKEVHAWLDQTLEQVSKFYSSSPGPFPPCVYQCSWLSLVARLKWRSITSHVEPPLFQRKYIFFGTRPTQKSKNPKSWISNKDNSGKGILKNRGENT